MAKAKAYAIVLAATAAVTAITATLLAHELYGWAALVLATWLGGAIGLCNWRYVTERRGLEQYTPKRRRLVAKEEVWTPKRQNLN